MPSVLAARFRIFSRPIDLKPDKAVKIVKACTALHNFLATTERARYMPAAFVDTTSDTGEVQLGEWRQRVAGDRNMVDGPQCSVGRVRPSRRAALVREQLADYFLSDAGVFPHQYSVLRLGGTDQYISKRAMRQLWLVAIGYSAGAKISRIKDFRVCSAHFSEDDYIPNQGGKRKKQTHFKEFCCTSTTESKSCLSSCSAVGTMNLAHSLRTKFIIYNTDIYRGLQ
ncbi:unnamed protein product [Leuciscus chuanchicus]